MMTTTVIKDPVCGMEVKPDTAAGQTEHQGQMYYFCGSTCKERFDLNPERYTDKSAEVTKGGHSCCG